MSMIANHTEPTKAYRSRTDRIAPTQNSMTRVDDQHMTLKITGSHVVYYVPQPHSNEQPVKSRKACGAVTVEVRY